MPAASTTALPMLLTNRRFDTFRVETAANGNKELLTIMVLDLHRAKLSSTKSSVTA